jgi:hypothetical protein
MQLSSPTLVAFLPDAPQVRALDKPFLPLRAYADNFERQDVSGFVLLKATDAEIVELTTGMGITNASHKALLREQIKAWRKLSK